MHTPRPRLRAWIQQMTPKFKPRLKLLVAFSYNFYLSSCHDFQQVVGVCPSYDSDEEQGRDGCYVATVEEGVGNPQEPCAQTEVHHKEEPQKDVHSFGLFLPATIFLPPKAHRYSQLHSLSLAAKLDAGDVLSLAFFFDYYTGSVSSGHAFRPLTSQC